MAESTVPTVLELLSSPLFKVPAEKLPLLDRIGEELFARSPGAAAEGRTLDEVKAVVRRLFVERVLTLPDNADAGAGFSGDFVDLASNAIATALKLSGQGHLAAAVPLGTAAVKFILDKFNQCGGIDRGNAPDGPVAKQNPNGRFVLRYFLECDPVTKDPLLPAVEGSPWIANNMLEWAFTSWAGRLKLDVCRADDVATANLIVTGKTFGGDIPRNVLALTDIGPPGGISGGRPTQLRMVFDLGETYSSKTAFAATAAHEIGHALGIRHRDVSQSRQLMNDMLSDIYSPQQHDLEAAVRKGWTLS